jgi:hypothetical protein
MSLETPFPDPPFQQGIHQRGKTAGGTSAAAFMARTAAWSLFLSMPLTLRLPSARRRPTGCRRHSAAQPPLRHGPQGPGAPRKVAYRAQRGHAIGQAATGSARSLQRRAGRASTRCRPSEESPTAILPAQSNAACCPLRQADAGTIRVSLSPDYCAATSHITLR